MAKKSAPSRGKSSAKADITSLKTLRTPIGVAAFSYLQKPDDSFGKSRYRINVFFPNFKTDPEFKKFASTLVELQNTFLKENNRKPSKLPVCMKITDEKMKESAGQPVGTPYIAFESAVNERNEGGIPVFDAAGQPSDALVYGGDIVRVETSICGWALPQSAGIKGYLRAVQLLKSNWQGGAGNTFEQEDEFLQDTAEADESVADELEDEFDEDAEEQSGDESDSEETEDDPTAGLL